MAFDSRLRQVSLDHSGDPAGMLCGSFAEYHRRTMECEATRHVLGGRAPSSRVSMVVPTYNSQ